MKSLLTKTCIVCEAKFTKSKNISMASWIGNARRPHGVRYCSKACQNIARKGRTAWNKGIETQKWSEDHRIARVNDADSKFDIEDIQIWKGKWSGARWYTIRNLALIRDAYTCQSCGFSEPEIMQVDHIKQRSKYPELSYRVDNCMTLCPNCHARKTLIDRENTTIANA